MNGPEGFDIKDGIFRVGVTGLYMFTVHALPMAEQPFMVQIHHNGQSVAAFSNGIKGTNIFFSHRLYKRVFLWLFFWYFSK